MWLTTFLSQDNGISTSISLQPQTPVDHLWGNSIPPLNRKPGTGPATKLCHHLNAPRLTLSISPSQRGFLLLFYPNSINGVPQAGRIFLMYHDQDYYLAWTHGTGVFYTTWQWRTFAALFALLYSSWASERLLLGTSDHWRGTRTRKYGEVEIVEIVM